MSTRITKLLIANRGEIAARIARTAARMGISTVAVFSDADADAPFVRACDEAVRIGPPPSRESYLSIERLLEAARRTGADAVHPGFGFLAENADFAQAVIDAGLVFVGPTPDAIRAMGSKQRAKRLAVEAGVPVVPGYDGADQDPAVLAQKALELGLPVLVKASAGGGGKGMRIVREESALAAAIEGAAREAEKSFGDGTLLIEKYLERPRHIEIQILGDAHGEVVHLLERECSIQRRHQKIIEEAPSPAVDRALRQRMGDAAVKLARSIGYKSAGTVEMILDAEGAFYFLEVNTRLQVEHPVTEAITDTDIVELQLRVARGEPLPLDQDMVDTLASGSAIECRIYAEDPEHDFLPGSGRVLDWDLPAFDWLRVDAGVETGSEVSIHYDPMLAKVITWGLTRSEAIARMRYALERLSVLGLTTNRDFLLRVLAEPDFEEGALSTHFIEDHGLAGPAPVDLGLVRRAAIFATLHAQAARAPRTALPTMRSGFRNNRFAPQEQRLSFGDETISVGYEDLGGERFRVDGAAVHRVAVNGPAITLELEGHRVSARVASADGHHHVLLHGRTIAFEEEPRFPVQDGRSTADGAFAPMPGQIVKVLVSVGEAVRLGQILLVMEAMKMEHSIGAPHAGVVTEVRIAAGQQVSEGDVMIVVKAEGEVAEVGADGDAATPESA